VSGKGKCIGWTHNMCTDCYTRWTGRKPIAKINDGENDRCCLCGEYNTEGVYMRESPTLIHPRGLRR